MIAFPVFDRLNLDGLLRMLDFSGRDFLELASLVELRRDYELFLLRFSCERNLANCFMDLLTLRLRCDLYGELYLGKVSSYFYRVFLGDFFFRRGSSFWESFFLKSLGTEPDPIKSRLES